MLAALGLLLIACGARTEADRGAAATASTAEATTSTEWSPRASNEAETIPDRLRRTVENWATDFSKTTIDLNELLVGIPAPDPRDLIPPIDEPSFAAAADTSWIDDREPGVLLELGDDIRFYPLSVLTRHEIVNDTVGGIPVAVTYCPLCNTAVTFDRRMGGSVLRFGVSGLLRHSDLVMWDDSTESLWQQVTGEAIVGELAGERLDILPGAIVRWADFREAHPEGRAMTADQGFGISYGTNPYELYSSRDRPFGFFEGEIDDRLPALERVVGVTTEQGAKAYPFSTLQKIGVVNDEIEGQHVVVFWGASETADALDAGDISAAAAIGTGVAYDPVVSGQRLTFERVGDATFTDVETGSTWSILGEAHAGALTGTHLALLPHRNDFWFAWHAFFPDAEFYEG